MRPRKQFIQLALFGLDPLRICRSCGRAIKRAKSCRCQKKKAATVRTKAVVGKQCKGETHGRSY